MRVSRVLSGLTLIFGIAGAAPAQIDARMLREPDVSRTQIVFVYAGDIWVAPKGGGVAHRLSSPQGEESFPRFSPDGSRIAFTGYYDGNADVYVVDADGGLPERLTHHPASDRLVDWHPDGESILYATTMTSGRTRFNQLYRVDAEGGLPEKLPMPYGEFGAYSPDGSTLAYIPISRDFRTWKRYRGGMAPDIWLFNLDDYASKRVTTADANDSIPMWRENRLYYLSDRGENKRANLWVFDLDAEEHRQVTRFEDYDVRFPAIGPDEIVLENGGRLYLLDLESEELSEVEVQVITDQATLKPRRVKVSDLVRSAHVSPSGKRALIEARGEVFSVPAEHGVVRNLTNSSGHAERYPVWSPDGKHIVYFSDRSGEYELTLREAGTLGEEERLTTLGPGYRYTPQWSPDSSKIVFVDQTMAIQLYDREADTVSTIDNGIWMYHGNLSSFRVSWSADSRWIAYSRGLQNRRHAVFLYDSESGELTQATSGFYSDARPWFDPDGKYLFFFTDRDFDPIYSDLDNTWIYANTTRIAALTLRKEVDSPLAPRNDEEEVDGEDEKDENEDDDSENGPSGNGEEDDNGNERDEETEQEDEVERIEIDLDGIEHRVVLLPPKRGNYSNLRAVKGKVLYIRRPRTGSGDEKSPLVYYDLKERKEETILDDVDGFDVSANGKKLLARKDRAYSIIDAKKGQKMDKKLSLGALEMTLDPRAEWKQIFTDAWRFERDFFYDAELHGVDWDAMREQYGALLDDAVTRWDVNYVIGELIAELNASHTYRGGGDVETPSRLRIGLLGADFELANGAYRIAHIVRGAPWDVESRSPLLEPGVDVEEGEYLLAVNGTPVDVSAGPWAAFEGLAGDTVQLTVNDEASRDGAREILVKTLSSEVRLRNLEWIEQKRRRVEEATNGRVGYIYVPSTGQDGQTELVRMFAAQFDKEGLIIDERFNSGGQIPDRFVELLNRPLYNYWGVRHGMDWQWPPVAHDGPQVMLVNGWSGSGGDAFPYYFREAGLGPLIGTRTWGGLIGITGAPSLIDGGSVTVPTFGIYSTEGEWIIEGYGVEPDIEVVDDPTLMAKGVDPQLERAIEEVMSRIEEEGATDPGKPEYPVRSR